MSNPIPQSQPTPNTDRKPGRSFSEPQRPLGEDMIARGEPVNGVADRAKAVAVLRKAEELMATHNPDGSTPEGRRRALELACGRAGVAVEEYEAICAHDVEVQDLERQVMNAATTEESPKHK